MSGTDKFDMFKNRLTKVYRHLHKIAKRQNISCYRIYDHDLPEFPFIIEKYGNKLYISEYKRNHSLNEEAHQFWMMQSIQVMSEVLDISPDNVFTKLRQRKAGARANTRKQLRQKANLLLKKTG